MIVGVAALSFLSGYGLFKAVPTKKGDLLSSALEISPYKSVFLYGRFCDLIFRGSLV